MAAKEESLVLKYLKKNPGSEALDVSFGTDIDEVLVKEALETLFSKNQVSKSVSDSGVATWNVASGPAPKAESPKSSSSVTIRSEDTRSSNDDSSSESTGTGKGFVIVIALLTAIVSIGVSYFAAASAISAERAKFDLQLKNATDSVGFYKITTNQKLDALEQEIKKLQAPPAAEEKKAEAEAPKKKKKHKKS
jgi:hypothetical protein